MKKTILSFFITALVFTGCIFLTACGDYSPNLTKTISKGYFEMKVTEDFNQVNNFEDTDYVDSNQFILLESKEDSEINSFNQSLIVGQIDGGSLYYNFEDTTLEQYVSDSLQATTDLEYNLLQKIVINEKVNGELKNIQAELYIAQAGLAPNGNWDDYYIALFSKTSTSFVYFNFYSSLLNENLENWKKKCVAIAESIIISPLEEKTYDHAVESYISSTLQSSGDVLESYNMVLTLPSNYEAILYPNAPWYNYYSTNSNDNWSSSIMFSALSGFMGSYYPNKQGAMNYIKYTKDNNFGYYIKESEIVEDLHTYTYYIFLYDSSYNCNRYSMVFYLSCSEELFDLGFVNYFEQQMQTWVKDLEFIA